jgi:hypothetical protein
MICPLTYLQATRCIKMRLMKLKCLILLFFIYGCSVPASVKRVSEKGVTVHSSDFEVPHDNLDVRPDVDVIYLGCGGSYLVRNGEGLLIDPFFSNQKFGKIGRSVLLSKKGKANFKSDPDMIAAGINALKKIPGQESPNILAIINSHSHYDHLMDIPAVYQQLKHKPEVLINESGFNTCHEVIDTANMIVLEKHMVTHDAIRPPVKIRTAKSRINIYPILADHNPHFRNIKFFVGANTKPVSSFSDPYAKTKANLWLEGKTFSFLIDYLDENDQVDYRIFIQSSSCNPPAGIPPATLLDRPVDLALLGIVSYSFSPDYPCEWLNKLSPRDVVWLHWEDFFRKYTKEPKTIRGTDIPGFFDVPCVQPYKKSAKFVWPRTKIHFVY